MEAPDERVTRLRALFRARGKWDQSNYDEVLRLVSEVGEPALMAVPRALKQKVPLRRYTSEEALSLTGRLSRDFARLMGERPDDKAFQAAACIALLATLRCEAAESAALNALRMHIDDANVCSNALAFLSTSLNSEGNDERNERLAKERIDDTIFRAMELHAQNKCVISMGCAGLVSLVNRDAEISERCRDPQRVSFIASKLGMGTTVLFALVRMLRDNEGGLYVRVAEAAIEAGAVPAIVDVIREGSIIRHLFGMQGLELIAQAGPNIAPALAECGAWDVMLDVVRENPQNRFIMAKAKAMHTSVLSSSSGDLGGGEALVQLQLLLSTIESKAGFNAVVSMEAESESSESSSDDE